MQRLLYIYLQYVECRISIFAFAVLHLTQFFVVGLNFTKIF